MPNPEELTRAQQIARRHLEGLFPGFTRKLAADLVLLGEQSSAFEWDAKRLAERAQALIVGGSLDRFVRATYRRAGNTWKTYVYQDTTPEQTAASERFRKAAE